VAVDRNDKQGTRTLMTVLLRDFNEAVDTSARMRTRGQVGEEPILSTNNEGSGCVLGRVRVRRSELMLDKARCSIDLPDGIGDSLTQGILRRYTSRSGPPSF
jgi:hypothetical protein